MATGNRNDPYRGFSFLVEIDGMTRAGFQECSGLDFTHDPVDYREVNEGPTAHKLPGQVKYATISLKRGITQDLDLWEWRRKARDGKVERKNGSIVLLDAQGEEQARWNFREGWPTRWTGPDLNATGNEVAIETLEIVVEGLEQA